MTPVDHLHEEAKVLPVREHNMMLCKQYLLGCYRRSHPSFQLMDRQTPPRHVRKDLHDLEREVQRYKREPLDQSAYRAGSRDIHSDTVAQVVNNYRMNVLIGAHPLQWQQKKRTFPERPEWSWLS